VQVLSDGANAVSGWNSAMEFCRKSNPTITMRKSSRKEHINEGSSKIVAPGQIQFSAKNDEANLVLGTTQVLGTPAETVGYSKNCNPGKSTAIAKICNPSSVRHT